MGASEAFFRLLCYLAAGGFVALALTPSRGVSRGFFRFSSGLYAGLAAAGLAIVFGRAQSRPVGPASGLIEPATPLFVAAALLGATHAALLPRRAVLVAAALAMAVATLCDGYEFGWAADHTLAGATVAAASALTSALLLGSVLTSMTLGHWYLVMPALPPDPLVRLARLYAGAVLARAAAIGAVFASLASSTHDKRALDHFLDRAGLILWPRLLFGVVAAGVLALMALPTARARDTQPATGMLYVACVLVLAGEGIAHYLWVKTWVPI